MQAFFYDMAISKMTGQWYGHVLKRLPENSSLLDVGIGTGGALLKHSDVLKQKCLLIDGIDTNSAYVKRCQRAISKRGLTDLVSAETKSVYDGFSKTYDAVYFSGSFMVLTDPLDALLHMKTILNPSGMIYFTQTFENSRSAFWETLKPLIKLATTIDFGRVTYEVEFRQVISAAGLTIVEMVELSRNRSRSARLVSVKSTA